MSNIQGEILTPPPLMMIFVCREESSLYVENALPWYSRFGLYNHFYTESIPGGGIRFMPRYIQLFIPSSIRPSFLTFYHAFIISWRMHNECLMSTGRGRSLYSAMSREQRQSFTHVQFSQMFFFLNSFKIESKLFRL